MKYYFYILIVLSLLLTSNHYIFAENSTTDILDSMEIVISPFSYNQQCQIEDNCFLPNIIKADIDTIITV